MSMSGFTSATDCDFFQLTELGTPYCGTITVENSEDGGHQAYQVTYQKKDAKFAPDSYILSALTGPDRDRKGLAFIRVVNGNITVYPWRSHAGTAWEKHAKLIQRAYRANLPEKYVASFSGACAMCGRELTNPESIRTGIGPICAEKNA